MKRMAVTVFLTLSLLTVAAIAQFTEWSAPENLGPPINTAYLDTCVSISKSGLSLYFASNRHTGNAASPDWDLYVSQRDSVDDPWGPPQSLPSVNLTGPMDSCPALSLDEHRLYFASNRPGGCGGGDFYVSRRHDRRDDFGWGPPENLGCMPDGPNTPSGEYTPTFFEDERGSVVMYFSSNRSGSAGFDLYASSMRHDDTFGPGSPVTELNSAFTDQGVAVRRDGLEVIFGSDRTGTLGAADLWMAARSSTADPWSLPVNLTVLNSTFFDGGKMSFSFDGRQFYFRSNRAGAGDIFVVTRERLHGKKK
jgi:hypothetical protein